MRTLISIALTAGVALVLGAGQASALSSINLVYLGGSTNEGNCTSGIDAVAGHPGIGSGNCISVNSSDFIKFALTVTVDSLGMAAFAFDLRWDEDGENELDYVHADGIKGGSLRHRGFVGFDVANPSPPPNTITAGYGTVTLSFASQESELDDHGGYFYGFDATGAVTGPFVSSVSFRVAVVTFRVNNHVADGADLGDIRVGFFRTSGATFGDATTAGLIPNFGTFQIDSVPEPGTSLLMGMGVLGLILAGRASRKS